MAQSTAKIASDVAEPAAAHHERVLIIDFGRVPLMSSGGASGAGGKGGESGTLQ